MSKQIPVPAMPTREADPDRSGPMSPRAPAPAAEETSPSARAAARKVKRERRAHMFPLAFGLLDAHFSRVDFLDTEVGIELERLYRQHRPPRGPRPPRAGKAA